ncbi:hypothetical protein Pcinc_005392 [Petrolisthes cinctipes]|uniref:AMP-binding enzyme C-terminal domain-containing protein n=1 Tax=Petrolisthes cinctipes TaxID=88211 RepID=A0AAE1GF08_PETCI|nr:hypothetical protein Pcinc_005392 [Petrolisthes cinctipes]
MVCEGEEGELCVRGPGMMLGYANNQTDTSATLDSEVVGVKHQRLGEAPKAFVVLKPNAKVTAAQIQNHVEDRVASYKQLAGGVRFVDVIPRNPTGKILKRQLKECDLDPEFSV